MKTFICKDGSSLYYVQSGSMGSFLTPPGHASQKFEIVECRGGHEMGGMNMEYAANECDYLPAAVKHQARLLVRQYPGNAKDETWIKQVYTHLNHCYETPAGEKTTFGKFWGNAEAEKDAPLENHCAVRYIRKYDPTHQPRVELMDRG